MKFSRFLYFLLVTAFIFIRPHDVFSNDIVVRIGLSYSATGTNATPSVNGLNGIQAMIDWVNEGNVCIKHKGCLKFELINKGDDQSSTSKAFQFYQELIADESVDFLIGPYGTAATAVVDDEAETNSKLLVAPFAATDSLFAQRSKWRVQITPPASTYLQTLIDLLSKTDTANQPLNLVLPAENDEFAKSVNTSTRAYLDQKYGSAFSVLFDSSQTSCPGISASDEPCYYPLSGGAAGSLEAWVDDSLLINTPVPLEDVGVISAGHNADGVRLTKKLRDLGINPKVLALTISPSLESFFSTVGPYARGVLGHTVWHEPQEIYTEENTPNGFDFYGPVHNECSQRIRAINGNTTPSYHAGSGGLAILVLAKAIQTANGIRSPEKVSKALHDLKLQTCFGQYQVNRKTGYQEAARMLIVQWQTPEDDPALTGPSLRVVAAPANLDQVNLDPLVYPKP